MPWTFVFLVLQNSTGDVRVIPKFAVLEGLKGDRFCKRIPILKGTCFSSAHSIFRRQMVRGPPGVILPRDRPPPYFNTLDQNLCICTE